MDTNNSSALWMNETLRQYALDNIGINDDQWHALCHLFSSVNSQHTTINETVNYCVENIHILEKSLHNNQVLLSTVLDNMGACVYMKSLDGRYLYANNGLAEVVKKSPLHIIGLRDTNLFTQAVSDQLKINDQIVIDKNEKLATLETLQLINDTELQYYWSVKVPLHDSSGKIYALLGISTDMTERKKLEDNLLYLATTDELTQLYNRRQFLHLSEQTLNRSKRYNEPLTLLMCDIDFFKHINDTFGHAAGDLVLQKVSQILKSALRETDIAGRVGGEEFAILLVQTPQEISFDVAERLRKSIENCPIYLEDGINTIPITVSIGVASPIYPYETLSSLMQRADQSLYQAKRSGRNQVCLAA